MAVYRCPSCGSLYNGKRCRSCLYEHFTEEIAHGNHTHKGEPLVIDAPTRKPIRRKNPFDCEKKTRKKHPLAGFLVLLMLINAMMPLLRSWGLELEAREHSLAPEPVMAVPEDTMILYADSEFQVLAQWKNGQAYTDEGIRIWVENDTGHDLTVSLRDAVVNGYMMDTAFFYCDVRDGSLAMSTLYLSEEGLENAGIRAVTDISFCLEAMDQDSYETILTTHRIDLAAAPAAGTVVHVAPEGALIYDQEGIRVSFLGYREDEYHPENVSEGQLLFHIENNTDRHLQVCPLEVQINGEISDVSLWCQLYPGTRAVSPMYLYSLKELGIQTAEELFPMTLTLEFTDREDYEFSVQSDDLVLMEG